MSNGAILPGSQTQESQSAIQNLLQPHSVAGGSPDHLQILSDLIKVHDATGMDLDSDHVMDQLHQALNANTKTAVAAPADDSPDSSAVNSPITPPEPSDDGFSSSPTPMLVTPLGAIVVNSTAEPVATINDMPTLPTASSISSLPDPTAAVVASNVAAVDPVAPQNAAHAEVWQQAIDAGNDGGSVAVNGTAVSNPSLVTTDSTGQLVQVPLAATVNASTPIPADQARPVAVDTPDLSNSLPQASLTQPPTVTLPDSLAGGGGQSDPSQLVPPGFVLAGNIQLFGSIDAQHYSFHGAAVDDVTELAVPTNPTVALGDLIPASGKALSQITLQKAKISVCPKVTSTGRAAGIWLDASVNLEESLKEIGDLLKDVCGVVARFIDVSICFGDVQSLSNPFPAPTSLVIAASLSKSGVKIGKFVELAAIEIESQGASDASSNTYTWKYALKGQVLLTVPGSVAPLAGTYIVTKEPSGFNLEIRPLHDEWTDAMGIPGLHLTNTAITSTFSKENRDSQFSFSIASTLEFGTGTVTVNGQYAGDVWGFHAVVGNMSLDQLGTSFTKLFNANLAPCPHTVALSNLTLDANSQNKSFVLGGSIDIDGYAFDTVTISLSSVGVHVVGDIGAMKFDSVSLTKAHMEPSIIKQELINPSPAKPGTSVKFAVSGEVQVASITLDAAVVFDREPGSALAWVVYAEANINHHLSDVVHSIPADLDLGLEDVVVMASNSDDASFPGQSFKYPVKKGFQLFAMIDCPHALAKSMHSSPGSMTLELDLGSEQEKIDLHFATSQNLTLKKGMIAPDIKAGILLSGTPQVFIEGDISVMLPGSPRPLTFGLTLQAGPTEAQASASLLTDWVNPFNISPQVKVLSPVTLGVIIDYVAATYPSGLNFAGGIQIGQTTLRAAFEVGENPTDGVLLIQADNLGIRDIVSFISLIIDHKLPMPSSDILFFKDLYLGISSGGSIGTVYYPPGLTFNADLLLFGKEIQIHAAVDRSLPGFKLHGEIETFNLGPLTVSGNTQKNAVVDMQFGPQIQHLLLDGKISLFDADLAITVRLDMNPLDLEFDAELKFSDLLKFTVKATVQGQVQSPKDIVHADFSFYADFEQSLLDHMMALANTYIAAAKKAADEGLESANTKLTQAEKSFNEHLDNCKRDLADAKAKWDKKSADVHAAVQAKRDSIHKDEQAKRKAVDDAHDAFNKKIAALQRNLDQTRADAANKIKAAQANLDTATRDANAKVDDATHKIQAAEQDLKNRFGDADRKINDAKSNVQAAQRKMDDLQRQVDRCNWEIHHGSVGDRISSITGLGVALGGGKAGLATAQGVLQAAYSIVNSTGYQAAQGALKASEGALDAAKKAADDGIGAAKGTLSAAQAAANASVAAAEASLNAAKTGCDELHVWKIAEDALSSYLHVEDGLLKAADAMEQDLARAAEKIAFDAANAALGVAQSATKELDAAKEIVGEVEKGVDHVLALGKWLVDHAGNIFNLKQVELGGSLSGAHAKQPFLLHIRGTFADCPVDVHAEFVPAQAEDMVKRLVMRWMDEAKADIGKFIKHH